MASQNFKQFIEENYEKDALPCFQLDYCNFNSMANQGSSINVWYQKDIEETPSMKVKYVCNTAISSTDKKGRELLISAITEDINKAFDALAEKQERCEFTKYTKMDYWNEEKEVAIKRLEEIGFIITEQDLKNLDKALEDGHFTLVSKTMLEKGTL